METHFLRAEWNNVIMANYIVPKEILFPFIPFKTELDFFSGNTYISLVGFMFMNTRIYGLSIPFHINFEEVNLRCYVRYNDHGKWKKGVVFIKEIVPKQSISMVANTLYNEKYSTMKMNHYHYDKGDCLKVGYQWEYKNKWNKLEAVTNKKSSPITKGSPEEFIADHYFGYTRYSHDKTYEYEVKHPLWETLKVLTYSVDCDFGSLYGEEFSFLNNENPESVFMTKGSEIKVCRKKEID